MEREKKIAEEITRQKDTELEANNESSDMDEIETKDVKDSEGHISDGLDTSRSKTSQETSDVDYNDTNNQLKNITFPSESTKYETTDGENKTVGNDNAQSKYLQRIAYENDGIQSEALPEYKQNVNSTENGSFTENDVGIQSEALQEDKQNVNSTENGSFSGNDTDRSTKHRTKEQNFKKKSKTSINKKETTDQSEKHLIETSDLNQEPHSKNDNDRHRDGIYDIYSDSDVTGGKSSLSNHTYPLKRIRRTPRNFSQSPRIPNAKKIGLELDAGNNPRQTPSLMAELANERTNRQPTTRDKVVSLPPLNSSKEIMKVYVDDIEKLANMYPKRNKDFKLEFVYDLKPKYPCWYSPEKRLSRRERKVYNEISGVYADNTKQDERFLTNAKKMEERLKQVEKIKQKERKERRHQKLEDAMTQYEQLKEVRQKFEIHSWYRNQTQYITTRVLEHEKISRHVYGLPESLEESEKMIKNLRRKNKKRSKNLNNRVKSQ